MQAQTANLFVAVLSCGPLITTGAWVWQQNKVACIFLLLQCLLFVAYRWALPWKSKSWTQSGHTDPGKKASADEFLRYIRMIHRGFTCYFILIALVCLGFLAFARLTPAIADDSFREAARDDQLGRRIGALDLSPTAPPTAPRNDVSYLAFFDTTKGIAKAFPADKLMSAILDQTVTPFFNFMWAFLLLSVAGMFGTFLAELVGCGQHDYQ